MNLDPRFPFVLGKDDDPITVGWMRRYMERFYEWHRELAEEILANEGTTFTWTPTPRFATPGDSVFTPSVAVGMGYKVRNEVRMDFNWVGTVTHTTAAGNLQLTGSPYALLNVSNYEVSEAIEFSGITKAAVGTVVARVSAGSPTMNFDYCGTGIAANSVTFAEVPTGGTLVLRGTVNFRANS